MLGHLGFLFVPQAEDAFIVGLGTGQTAAAVVSHPGVRVTVAELSEGVIEAQQLFVPYSGHVLERPEVTLVHGDARQVLRAARPETFDLVVSEPSNPWIVGIADLFTQDHFERVRSRLKPGGVLVQWIHKYQIGDALFKDTLCTLRHVFPAVWAFRMSLGEVALVASDRTTEPDLAAAAQAFLAPAVVAKLRGHGLTLIPDSLDELLATQLSGPATFDAICQGFSRPFRERRPRLDYEAPRDMFARRSAEQLRREIDRRTVRGEPLLLSRWLATHPLDEPRKRALFDFLMADPHPLEEPMRLALVPPDRWPPVLRSVALALPDPGTLSSAERKTTCDTLAQRTPVIAEAGHTPLGPISVRAAAWTDVCSERRASR